MAKGFFDKEEDERDTRERNIFRCALTGIGSLLSGLDVLQRAFIHKALSANGNPPLYIIS